MEQLPREPQTAEAPASGNNAKKWLIGCGGCLVLVIVLIIIAAIAGGTYFSNLSGGAMREVFGTYTPSNYTAFGFPMGQKEIKNMVFMANPQEKRMILGFDGTMNPADAQVLKSGDPKRIEEYVRHLAEQAQSNPKTSATTKTDLNDLHFDTVEMATLDNGKRFPLVNGKLSSEKSREYNPAVAALIPEASGKLVVLFAMDGKTASDDVNADFRVPQKTLENELKLIITDSELDERLQ